MLPDPKWLEALKLPLKATIAVALSCIALLLLDSQGTIELSAFGNLAKPTLIVLTVVASVLVLVGIGNYILAPLYEKRRQTSLASRRAVRRAEREEGIAAERELIIARLNYLSKEEIRYIADCLRQDTPSFYTYVYSPPVSMMQGKGLIWTPGGAHHQDHFPFSFYDFVWAKLVERKEEFITKDDDNRRADEAAEKARRMQRRY